MDGSVIPFFIIVGLVIVAIVGYQRFENYQFDKKREQKKLDEESMSAALRKRFIEMTGSEAEVVEKVFAKGGAYMYYSDVFYAVGGQTVLFSEPVDVCLTREETKRATLSQRRDYEDSSDEFEVEVIVNDLANPRVELWFLHEREANQFFARLSITAGLSR